MWSETPREPMGYLMVSRGRRVSVHEGINKDTMDLRGGRETGRERARIKGLKAKRKMRWAEKWAA